MTHTHSGTDSTEELSPEREVAVSKLPGRKKAHDPACGNTNDQHQLTTWHVAHVVLGYEPAPCCLGGAQND